MKAIFETILAGGERLLAYNNLNLDLIDRHLNWLKTKDKLDQNIYLLFFLSDKKQIAEWKSNRLQNNFCLVYCLEKSGDIEWIKNFCRISFTDEDKLIYQAANPPRFRG